MKLHRFLRRCGLGSARTVDAAIRSGRVEVNGRSPHGPLMTIGEMDVVTLDGTPLVPSPPRYLILNKPAGTVCVDSDRLGRTCVVDLVPGGREMGLFPAGRLDLDTTGLILLTNDGDMERLATDPRFGTVKEYVATVDPLFEESDRLAMERGVELEDGTRVDGIRASITGRSLQGTEVVVSLTSGKRHVVKRAFRSLGFNVVKLHRSAIGSIRRDGLPEGAFREMDGPTLAASLSLADGMYNNG